jgi:hypothetical protein
VNSPEPTTGLSENDIVEARTKKGMMVAEVAAAD